MLDQSGVVFTGQVIAVRHMQSILEIDFAVEDAILGATPNTTYNLREWIGLAPNADSAFLVGHRYLMFLHRPGPGGLSSPVGGPDGAIPILPGNSAASPTIPDTLGLAAQTALTQSALSQTTSPISPAHTNFRLASSSTETAALPIPLTSSALASSTVDLRWIATHVLSPIAYASGSNNPAEAHPIVTHGNAVLPAQMSLKTPTASPPTSSANYANLLAILHTWSQQDRAPR